jgi:hypothetical protein
MHYELAYAADGTSVEAVQGLGEAVFELAKGLRGADPAARGLRQLECQQQLAKAKECFKRALKLMNQSRGASTGGGGIESSEDAREVLWYSTYTIHHTPYPIHHTPYTVVLLLIHCTPTHTLYSYSCTVLLLMHCTPTHTLYSHSTHATRYNLGCIAALNEPFDEEHEDECEKWLTKCTTASLARAGQ